MPRSHYTLRHHLCAVLAVFVMSLVMAQVIQFGEARLGGGLKSPLAGETASIQPPSSSAWGQAVLRLAGLH